MSKDPSDISQTSSNRPATRTITFSLKPILIALVVIVLCGLSFLGGRSYQKHHADSSVATASSQSSTTNGGSFGAGGGTGTNRARAGGFGQVTAISSTSISIEDQRTSATTTYSITSATTITDNGSTVTTSDIQTGDTVLVRTSGSGSTTATAITVNPSFSGGFGGQQSSGDSSPAPTAN